MASRIVALAAALLLTSVSALRAQKVEDGSEAALGPADTRVVLDLIGRNLERASDAKVTSLRRSGGDMVCGSVDEKNLDGQYAGERGFVVDLSRKSFGRVPDGPELLSPRSAGFREKEAIRQSYFDRCLEQTYN